MSLDLAALAARARSSGWSCAQGSASDVVDAATELGWQPIPTRTGDPAVGFVRALSRDAAKGNSLSRRYGLGPFPLHTDGAHLQDPPELTILCSERTSTTPTLLWAIDFQVADDPVKLEEDLDHGLFCIADGRTYRLLTARSAANFRYDPGCMTPLDQRARRVATFFASMRRHAYRHLWQRAPHVLVIDNLRALHSRGPVHVSDRDRTLQRIMYSTGAKK